MKNLGHFLITAGFLLGAHAAVVDPETVEWTRYGIALALGIAGVAMVRIVARQASREISVVAGNLANVGDALDRLAKDVASLDAEKGEIDVYDLRNQVDRRFAADLEAFVSAREAIAHRHGLQAYADVMNAFAAGERYLNRVWSASADGYVDEAHDYLGRASEQLGEAVAIFEGLEGKAA